MCHQNSTLLTPALLDFLLYQKQTMHTLISNLHSFISRSSDAVCCNFVGTTPPSGFSFKPKELGAVLRSLGMAYAEEDTAELVTSDVLRLFEEEPRLDEVKEAFDVFDVNKDGFIDAGEVHRVLLALGIKEGSDVERCRRMIHVHDCNGDGVLDFDEFVNFMETCT